ncbi:MAG TPA: PEP-CTERM sorting domain-containing protein [Candidatus Hydrogenedentes bacterium]|jgi:hypothetical protein|nr:PEP-CTERM sorting domain-containing protein [Candidatus Hydrogenedentota bacterium]
MKSTSIALIVSLFIVGSAVAAPLGGTYNSLTDPSIVTGAESLWDDELESLGMFFAYGHPQWYVEAYDPEWNDGYHGWVSFGNNPAAPWFDPADAADGVSSYIGTITDWTFHTYEYTRDPDTNLVTHFEFEMEVTALLNEYNRSVHGYMSFSNADLSPIDDPVSVTLLLGFSGQPQINYYANSNGTFTDIVCGAYGELDGVAPVPEPASMTLMGLGIAGLALKGYLRRKHS